MQAGGVRDRRVVPLVWSEVAQAATCFPIVFRRGTGEARVMPHGLLKLDLWADSVFVGANGTWQAQCLPTRLAALPFDLIAAEDGRSYALGIDEDTLLTPDTLDATPIFAKDASLAEQTQSHTEGLRRHASCLVETLAQCAALELAGLLVPMAQLRPRYPGEADDMVIDQERLAALDATSLSKLHHSGALAMAYAQIISLHHVGFIARAEQAPDVLRRLSRPAGPVPGAAFISAFAAACTQEADPLIHIEPWLAETESALQ